MKRLSVVPLVYNERETVVAFYERLARVVDALSAYETEIIFVDDGSRDGSFAILQEVTRRDARVRILRLSRNFGSWNAVLAGIHAASGDAIMWISSDLQDPPELIPQLVRPWEEGAQVVWGVRARREDPWLRRIISTAFYVLLRRTAVPEYPALGVDVCLMDRRVATLFGGLREHHRFTQGLILRMGFTQVTVPYVRERRHAGRSKWGTAPRLAAAATDMIVAFSPAPLRLILYAGLMLTLAGTAGGAAVLVARVAYGAAVPGWMATTLAVLVVGGLQAAFLGILGEYVWRVLEEVRDRPHYIVAERVGFEVRRGSKGTGGEAAADERVAARPTRTV